MACSWAWYWLVPGIHGALLVHGRDDAFFVKPLTLLAFRTARLHTPDLTLSTICYGQLLVLTTWRSTQAVAAFSFLFFSGVWGGGGRGRVFTYYMQSLLDGNSAFLSSCRHRCPCSLDRTLVLGLLLPPVPGLVIRAC